MQTLKRRDDVDGLRALAVVSVVLYHAFNDLLKGGFVGVDVFFVISGYVITRLIYAEMQQGSFSFVNFYLRRLRRLYPALLLVLIFMIVMGWFIFLMDEYEKMAKIAASQFVYLNNFFNAFNTTYFDANAEEHPLTHLWSLAVEEQFYLIWPLMLFVALKRKANLKKLLFVLMGISFVFSLYLLSKNHNFAFYLPFGRFYEMMLGALLALEERNPSLSPKWREKYGNQIFVSGLALVLYACFFVKSSLEFPGFYALLPVVGTGLIIYAGSHSWLNQKLFANRYMVGIGLISYPLYLWHWPLFSLQFITQGQEINPLLRWCMVGLSFILAFLTYRFIEKPLQKINLKRSALMLYVSMAGVAAFSLWIIINEGVRSRPVLAQQNLQIHAINAEFTPHHGGILTCYDLIGFAFKGYKCIAPLDKVKPPLLLLGDSTSSALHKAAVAQLPNLKLFWRATCPPFVMLDLEGKMRREYAQCLEFSKDYAKFMAQNPKAEAIIIKSRVPAEFSVEPLTPKEEAFAKANGLQAETRFEVAYFNSYHRFLHTLSQQMQGKKMIVVYANPVFDKFAKSCLKRPFQLNFEKLQNPCTMSLAAHEARYAYYRRVLGVLETQFPHISFIKTEQHFCDAKECNFVQDNRLMYVDDLHLTPSGEALIIKDILKALTVLKAQ